VFVAATGLALVYVLSQTNRYATRVETGGFKFLVKGESLYQVIDNLPDHEVYVDQDTYRVGHTGRRRKIRWLEKWLGMIWISFLWPTKEVHSFEVVADKMKSDEEIATNKIPVRQQVKTETRRTDYLRFRFPHPVLVTNVELGGDRWQVDLIIMLDIIVINPATVVFGYKGRVLRQVDAAVSAATIDFWNDRKFNYQKFVATDKGPSSPFAKKILALNDSTAPGPQADGLADRFGVKIMAVWVSTSDLSPDQKLLDEAAKAVEKERHLADAATEKARGEAALEEGIRAGIGRGFREIIRNLAASGLTPEQTAPILQEQVRMSGIADSKLTTYVEGGGNVLPTLPTSPPTPPAPPQQQP
jgi:hypothetical protein